MFKNKKKENIPLSSDAVLYDKYKKIELITIILVTLGGVIISILAGLEYGYPELIDYHYTRIFMLIAGIFSIISFVVFTIYYFKIKGMK